jgi:dienelactone hydrolase
MKWFLAVCAVWWSVPWPLRAATDPAANGPFPSTRLTLSIPGTQNTTLTTDIYFPGTNGVVSPAASRCPVIVLGHGFSQSKDQHVNQGRHLATRGDLVLIPNSNAASDHSRYADDLRKCIDWIEARDADPNSLFVGRVRADRVGATGHSAGGLSAILAASRDPRIRAVSPMDPVDNGGLGVAALVNLAAPVAITYSEPSSCNADGSAFTLYNAALAPKRGLRIVGANHTDPLAADATPIVSASLVATNDAQFLATSFPLVTAASDITYRIEASTDLQTWLPGCTYSGTNRVTATAHTTEFFHTRAGLESIVVRDNTPVGTSLHRFLRLGVSQP